MLENKYLYLLNPFFNAVHMYYDNTFLSDLLFMTYTWSHFLLTDINWKTRNFVTIVAMG